MRLSRQQAHEEIAAVRLELAGVQAEAAAADRAAQRDREALIALRRELDQVRADVQSEREALRAAHTEQIAQIQRNADERAAALNQALDLARESAETYRAQLAAQPPTPSRSQGEQRTTARKRQQSQVDRVRTEKAGPISSSSGVVSDERIAARSPGSVGQPRFLLRTAGVVGADDRTTPARRGPPLWVSVCRDVWSGYEATVERDECALRPGPRPVDRIAAGAARVRAVENESLFRARGALLRTDEYSIGPT